MAGELVVTTNKPSYAPYDSIDTGDDLTVVVEDGDTLEITVTNSEADRMSDTPLQYYYAFYSGYWKLQFEAQTDLEFPGLVFGILPDGMRAPADPREFTFNVDIPSDFSARSTQFGASIGIEAWPWFRETNWQTLPWDYAYSRRRARVWVFSATAPMPTLEPTTSYLPCKIKENWNDEPRPGVSRSSGVIRNMSPSISPPLATANFEPDPAGLAERIADPDMPGEVIIKVPPFYERYSSPDDRGRGLDIGDIIVPTLPNADMDVQTALAEINDNYLTRWHRGTSQTGNRGRDADLALRIGRQNTSLSLAFAQPGYGKLGSPPMVRLSMSRLGRDLGHIDMPIRLIPNSGASVLAAGDTSYYVNGNGYEVTPTVKVPIGGRVPFTITLDDASTEDVTFTLTLPEEAGVELSTKEVTIPAGMTRATVYIEDTSDSGTEQTTTVTVTPPAGTPLAPVTVDVSVQQETPGLVPTPATLYTVDGLIQSTDDPDSVGYEMDASWGGESVFKDGAWHYLPGHARAPVAHISPADILAYDLRQIGPDAQDRINAASMSIAQNKDGDYLPFRLDTQVLEDARLVDGTPYEADLGTRGFITDSVHARQALSIALRRTRYPTLTALRISPGAKLERLAIHPGDIVTYTDARYGVYGERNRVMSSTVHPDLSMTLSLRGEPVTTYDPALPYLPPAAPTEPLWRRLFKVPTPIGSGSGHLGMISAEGDTLLLPGPGNDAGYSVGEYSTAGEFLGNAFEYQHATENDVLGMARFKRGDGAGNAIWARRRSRIYMLTDGPYRISGDLRSAVTDSASFDHLVTRLGPSAPSGNNRQGFIGVRVTGRVFDFSFLTADFSQFVTPGAMIAAGVGVTQSAVSSLSGSPHPEEFETIVERLDGTLLAMHGSAPASDGGGFFVVSTAGGVATNPAFTFQGVGDEAALNGMWGMALASDGRLYVVTDVSIGDDRDNYIYVRRNATDPDEERE